MQNLDAHKKVFKEIAQTILVPVVSVAVFFFWAYNLIRANPPKILIFPMSSLIIVGLYFISGPVYSGTMLAFVTVAGFLSVFLVDSSVDKLIFLAETFWLWGIFLYLEYYQKTYDGLENRNREEMETYERKVVLLGSKLEDSKKRIEDYSQRIINFQSLGSMVQQLGQTLDEEKITPLICELASRLIGKGAWKVKKGAQSDIFAQYIKNSQVPLIIRNLAADNRFPPGPARFASLIAVPLEVNQKYWGILRGVAAKEDYFDEGDLRLLSVLGGMSSLALNNSRLYLRTQELAVTDGLTGLYVHSYFKERLNEEIQRSLSHGLPLSIAMLDIDFFKHVNDTYGHAAGDAVLKQISDILRHRLRETDFVSRYGGEEFGVIMPQTDSVEAFRVIEEIRKSSETEKYYLPIESFHPVQVKITVSAGIANLEGHRVAGEDFIRIADEALYQAKHSGRNKTVISKKK